MNIYFTSFFIVIGFFLFSITTAQTPCEDGYAGIYPCEGFNLSSHFTLDELGGGVKGNDCWGWTDVESGREFVLYCRSSGMSFVEITDPINPVFTAVLPAAALESIWRDVKVLGDYAYIVSMADNHGMQILELTQLLDITAFPTILSESAHYSGFSFAHNFAVNEEAKSGYAIGTDLYNGGLFVVDLEDPLQPVLVGSFDESSTHDAQSIVYHGPDLDFFGVELVFCFNGDNVTILNTDDKSDIQVLSVTSNGENMFIHQGWVSEDHTMLYYNDEQDELSTGTNTRTFMMDISDLYNPINMGYYEYETLSTDHNLYVNNGLIYASNNSSGLRVSTILDDGTIELYGFFDTYPEDDASGFTGTWSNYPYFPSKNIAVSNRDGLFILRAEEDYIAIESVVSAQAELRITPNPASSSVDLSGPFTNCHIEIYELSGRKVLNVNAIPYVEGLNIDVSSINRGAYLMRVIDASSGAVKATEKLILTND